MTYPPAGGTPDPYQPQKSYDPTSQYPAQPYAAPGSPVPDGSVPGGYPPPVSGQPAYGQPAYGQPAYGQPAYGQPGYGQPYAPYGAQQRTNALAIASLVCSIAGLATCISAPVGVVLGHVAKKQIRETGEAGDGMATAGLWVGYILSALGLIGIIIYVIAIAAAIGAADSSSSF